MSQEEKKEQRIYFKGKEEELGGTIFGYGHKAQAELYNNNSMISRLTISTAYIEAFAAHRVNGHCQCQEV